MLANVKPGAAAAAFAKMGYVQGRERKQLAAPLPKVMEVFECSATKEQPSKFSNF